MKEIGNQQQTLYLVKFVIESRIVQHFGNSDDLKRQLSELMWKMTHCFDERTLAATEPPERRDVARILGHMFDLIESSPVIAMAPFRGTSEVNQAMVHDFTALRVKTGLKFDLRWRGDVIPG